MVHTNDDEKFHASANVCINQACEGQNDICAQWGGHLLQHMATVIGMHIGNDAHVLHAGIVII